MAIEKVPSFRQAFLKRCPIGEDLVSDGLLIDGLMAAFDDTMLNGWSPLDEAHLNIQGDQPQVECRRIGRSARVIIEDAVVI